jgi:hypothetical protein
VLTTVDKDPCPLVPLHLRPPSALLLHITSAFLDAPMRVPATAIRLARQLPPYSRTQLANQVNWASSSN